MANEIEKVNTIAIADIEKINGKTDDNIEKLNTFELAGVTAQFYGTRSVIAGGTTAGLADRNMIHYKTVGASADTADFGDLQSYRTDGTTAGSNITRGIFAGGLTKGADGSATLVYSSTDTDYITVGSTGNASDFGNLDDSRGYGQRGGASNGTLLFTNGGFRDSGYVNLDSMEYYTIASTGNGTDAGDLASDLYTNCASDGLTRYIVFGGNNGSSDINVIQYNDFSTSADTSDFGDLSGIASGGATAESTVRVVTPLGQKAGTVTDIMEYVTVSSTGNSTDFGDLDTAVRWPSGSSNGTLGEFFCGSNASGTTQNIIQKITIASTGNATDIGDVATGTVGGNHNQGSALSGT